MVEKGGTKVFVRDKGLAHTQKKGGGETSGNADIHESKEKDSSA